MRTYLLAIIMWFPVAAAQAPDAPGGRILVLGDSLSAAYGMALEEGWVALLQGQIDRQGYKYRLTNASISGATTRSARSRVDALLADGAPHIAIVELGGNDGLRGIALEEIRDNLGYIVERLSGAGARVLLLPMDLPPNYGATYIERFRATYAALASGDGVVLGSFPLADVALRPDLMQEDGIHPRAAAQPLIMERVWAALEPMLHGP